MPILLLPSLPPPHNNVCVRVYVILFIHVFVFLFPACVRRSSNITLSGTLKLFSSFGLI